MDHLDLAEDQREKLRQFAEFTHQSDYDVAVGTLASLNWNLEQAIEAHLMQDSDDIHDDPEIIETAASTRHNQQQQQQPPPIIDLEAEETSSARGRRRPRNEPETVDNQVKRMRFQIDDFDSSHGNNEPATRRGQAIPRRRIVDTNAGSSSSSSSSAGPSSSSSTSSASARRRGVASAPLASATAARSSLATATSQQHHFVESDDDEYMNVVYDDEDDDDDDAPISGQQSVPRSNGRVPLIPENFTSVTDALEHFVTVFSTRFCSSPSAHAYMPPFCTGPVADAVKQAFETPNTELRRPMVFYVNHEKSIAANIFAAQVVCSDQVSQLLRHQYVVYPWDISTDRTLIHFMDALQASNLTDVRNLIQRLAIGKVETFPIMAIVVKERNSYRLVDYCKGTDTSEHVFQKLMLGVEEYTQIRLTEDAERRERQERDAIRSQQEAEYHASLVADRARIEAKQREIEEQKAAERRRIEEEEAETTRRVLVASRLPAEPAADEQEVLAVKFRLPEGGQDMRRFRKSEPIQTLVDYLSSKGFCPEKYKYFNSDFPKKELTRHFDLSHKFGDAKWPAREQIFVEEI